MARNREIVTIEGREIALSNVEKVLYPAAHFRKGEVIDYYARVSEYLLPHFKDRPVTLKRYPDGVRGECFYQKDAPNFTPKWVKRCSVPRRGRGGAIHYILINDRPTLVWVANLASLELHPFLHRAPNLDRPAAIVFDLDPGPGADLLTCVRAARLVRDLVSEINLKCFPKVSGSKGLQVYIPLNTDVAYGRTRPFAKAVAELMERRHPSLIVSKMAKEFRARKVLIDWSQNSDFKTTVGVYSLRAKSSRPYVSMPVRWEELGAALENNEKTSLFFEPEQALERIAKLGDLFAPVLTLKQRLPPQAAEMLARRSTASVSSPSPAPLRAPKRDDKSALTGRTMKQIAESADRQGQSNRAAATPRNTGKNTVSSLTHAQTARRGATRATEKSSPEPNRDAPQGTLHLGPEPDLSNLPNAKLAFIEPMLAQPVSSVPEGAGWQYEIKLDGYRTLATKTLAPKNEIVLFSRRGNRMNPRFHRIAAALEPFEPGTMLDGEVVALDAGGRPQFNELQHAKPGQPLYYYAFDILAYRGKDVRALPLSTRRDLLMRALKNLRDPIRLSPAFDVPARDIINAVREQGLEGIVAKRADSIYESGKRSGAWVKYKTSQGQELVIGGYLPGPYVFDSLLVGYYDGPQLMFLAKVRNGFTPALRREVAKYFRGLETGQCPFANLPEPSNARRGKALTKEVMKECRWLKPELVAQFAFTDWTAGNHLRHSRFIALRGDTDPHEVKKVTVASAL